MGVIKLIIIYLIIVNIIGLATMGIDKRRAIKRGWRISEVNLFTIALIGGCLGTTLGMFLFRHKTRHWYFAYGMPIILFIQVAIIVALHFSPIQFAFL